MQDINTKLALKGQTSRLYIYGDENKNVCLEYKLMSRIKRKYIKPILEDTKDLCKSLKNTKYYHGTPSLTRRRIVGLFNSIESKFNHIDYKRLLEKELTYREFVILGYEIRDENFANNHRK